MNLRLLKKRAEKELKIKNQNIVFGEGPSKAKIMFIGEAPGKQELKTGRPFVGRAGKFLDELLKKNKINRKKIYITSVLKFLPKKITKDYVKKSKPYLLEQIKIIKPKKIVLLGNLALKTLINEKLTISKVHGKKITKDKITYLPMFHPAAGMRFPKIKKEMEKDFKLLKII